LGKSKGLTVRQLESLEPRAEPYEIKDDAEAGLYVCVLPSGLRSFVWRYRFHNKSRKLTLGPVTLAEARKRARGARNLRDDGVDPAQQKRDAKAARIEAARQAEREATQVPLDDIERVVGAFVERHCKGNGNKEHELRTWRRVSQTLQKEIICRWKGRRLSQISKDDIRQLLNSIVERGAPVQANRVFAHLRKLCGWAVDAGITDFNPCEGIKRPTKEKSRERVLIDEDDDEDHAARDEEEEGDDDDDDNKNARVGFVCGEHDDRELALVWKASRRLGYPFGPMIQLLILTGVRRNEIAESTWS
jgi:integrase